MTGLTDIIRALSNPKAYPEPTGSVTTVQTQMSAVFLTDDMVYKIKKPVNLGYLDYTTLVKRHRLCNREVRLNRRLCPEVYLGVVPITVVKGSVVLGGTGKPIEYAVKMKRLPQDRMMDSLLAQDRVTPAMINRLAEKVGEFHKNAAASKEISKLGTVETIRYNTQENFNQTVKYIPRAIMPDQYRRVVSYTNDFLEDRGLLFQKRVQDRKIRDCHGDLHSQHICFTDGICIYDCIEFNDRFRYVDVAAEVSFLAMDIDRWGHRELSKQFVNTYVQTSGDTEILELLNFYKCYFSYVRAKVNCFRLDDPLLPDEEKAKALAEAKRYFSLAEAYTAE